MNSARPPLAYAEEVSYIRLSTSPMIIARFIKNYCNTAFLSGVIRSKYNFLYRGLSPDEIEAVTKSNELAAIIIKEEQFDLLDSNTYNSTESVDYFRSLENKMTAMRMPLKPSNSHIGTTNPKDAAQWGKAASIWPLGEEGVDFAWLADGGLFWPIQGGKHIMERKVITSSVKISGDRKCDGLATALRGDAWEIMFRADNGFVVVPAELDCELKAHLVEMQLLCFFSVDAAQVLRLECSICLDFIVYLSQTTISSIFTSQCMRKERQLTGLTSTVSYRVNLCQ